MYIHTCSIALNSVTGICRIGQSGKRTAVGWNGRSKSFLFDPIFLPTKELPRVNRAQDSVEDQKSQLLGFSEILLEFCCILAKVYKNVHFTEFHLIL